MKNFIFLVWSNWDYWKKTCQLTFPFLLSPGLLICKPFQDFGFLLYWEGEEFGYAEKMKAAKASSHTQWHGRKGSFSSSMRSLALYCSSCLLLPDQGSGCGSRHSNLWQRSHLLKPLPRVAFYAQAKPFYLRFPRWLKFVPTLQWALCFQELPGFSISHELRALIALIVFTPAYFHCGCHYSCVMFLLSLLSRLSLPWQAQSDSLIHIC